MLAGVLLIYKKAMPERISDIRMIFFFFLIRKKFGIQYVYYIGWRWGLYENILHAPWMLSNEPYGELNVSAVYSHIPDIKPSNINFIGVGVMVQWGSVLSPIKLYYKPWRHLSALPSTCPRWYFPPHFSVERGSAVIGIRTPRNIPLTKKNACFGSLGLKGFWLRTGPQLLLVSLPAVNGIVCSAYSCFFTGNQKGCQPRIPEIYHPL